MEGIALVYEHPGAPGQQEYTMHHYPYTKVPPIRSHIEPQYVLLQLSAQLKDLDGKQLAAMETAFPRSDLVVEFGKIASLYTYWHQAPQGWELDDTFNVEADDPNDKSYRSAATASVASSGRTRSTRVSKRSHQNAEDGPSEGSGYMLPPALPRTPEHSSKRAKKDD